MFCTCSDNLFSHPNHIGMVTNHNDFIKKFADSRKLKVFCACDDLARARGCDVAALSRTYDSKSLSINKVTFI